jgi:NAD+-processing family protein with receiver domain
MSKPTITLSPGRRVLIIEDNQGQENTAGRIGWFLQRMPHALVTIAKTPRSAVSAVRDGVPYDIIFLDYDSGLTMWYDGMPDDDTFIEAARLIAQHKFQGVVIIHSMNPAGAMRMAKMLDPICETRVMPFGFFHLRTQEPNTGFEIEEK